MDEKVKECSISEDGSVIVCWALDRMLDGRALRQPSMMNFKTGVIRHPWVVLHTGEERKRGLIMNYCPFCGKQLFDSEAASAEET